MTDTDFWGMPLPPSPVDHGFAIGVFDLLHVGHLRYLQQARQHCKNLTVAVTVDHLVERYKKRPPAISHDERLELVAGLACVTRAISHEISLENTLPVADWIAGLDVQQVFIGDDWAGSARWNRLGPVLQDQGIAVSFIPRTATISSSDIRKRLGILAQMHT